MTIAIPVSHPERRVPGPTVADLYPLHAARAAPALTGIEPQVAGGVLPGDDVLMTIAIPVGQPERRVPGPAVADLYPLHAAPAAPALAGIEPQVAGGVLPGDDVLMTIAIPVGQPERRVRQLGELAEDPGAGRAGTHPAVGRGAAAGNAPEHPR